MYRRVNHHHHIPSQIYAMVACFGLSIHINYFLKLNNILVDEKFGFKKNLSTDKALFNFRGKIFSALNNKMYVGKISFGVTKAFDSVNHKLLLSKLNFMEFQM
jgi:hypothetical protein